MNPDRRRHVADDGHREHGVTALLVVAAVTVTAITVGFPAVPAALFAGAWLMWRSIPRDLRTIRDFDRARCSLERVHQRVNGRAR